MKKTLLFILVTFFVLSSFAQTAAYSFGGTAADNGRTIVVDASGNVYTTGYFQTTVDFDPGAGTASLTSAGSQDIFISKLDAAGNYVWAKRMGSTSADIGYSIALDASGNVYTTGIFQGTADFDPGAGTANLTSAGAYDIFICKLDAAGNYVWAKSMGGLSGDAGYAITVDAGGNVYTTGVFPGTADFDPGAGTANLTSAGSNDIFISKLDAAGNYVWAKSMGGTAADISTCIALDGTGNVYTTGYFPGTADFDPGAGTANLTSAGGNDIFISKLDAAGNYVWAIKMGGTFGDNSYSIALDAAGNIYTTGYFQGTADFDPGAGIANLTSAAITSDIFVSKLDAAGNYVWAKSMGGTNVDIGYAIAVDGSGSVYTTGYFQGTVDFDPGAGTASLTSAGSQDIFISKLDAAGNYVWAKGMGSTSGDNGYGIALDASGNIYTTGYFSGTVDFDPDAGVINLTSNGNTDIFVSKLSTVGTLPLRLIQFSGAVSANSNNLQWHTADESNTKEFIIERSTNGSNFSPVGVVAAKGNGDAQYNFTDNNLPVNDLLYYRLKMVDMDGRFTYSNIIRFSNKPVTKLIVYPNPVADKATMQTDDKTLIGTSAKIINGNGQAVYSFTISSNFEIIDMSKLSPGIYVLQLGNGVSQKIVKK